MIHVSVRRKFKNLIDISTIEGIASLVIDNQSPGCPADVSIVFEDDAHLQSLNHQFRGFDAPTDVLSFPAQENNPDTGNIYLGDVVVSVERASEQASSAGHPLMNELSLLVIHGILHLFNFDHDTEENKQIMWKAQSDLIASMQIHIQKLPED